MNIYRSKQSRKRLVCWGNALREGQSNIMDRELMRVEHGNKLTSKYSCLHPQTFYGCNAFYSNPFSPKLFFEVNEEILIWSVLKIMESCK